MSVASQLASHRTFFLTLSLRLGYSLLRVVRRSCLRVTRVLSCEFAVQHPERRQVDSSSVTQLAPHRRQLTTARHKRAHHRERSDGKDEQRATSMTRQQRHRRLKERDRLRPPHSRYIAAAGDRQSGEKEGECRLAGSTSAAFRCAVRLLLCLSLVDQVW